ncbi:MAG: hypothetical protein IJL72_09825 [Lachnospiraceae bacterium]|nr:hypothetical protein [Lachnospiraceae bacterium]
MMQSKVKITRTNAMDLIRRFAKAYRTTFGKAPAEIIIVGGGSIMLNYTFRDSTQDFDVILRAASGIKDVITRFADENNLPRDWMNTDFVKTASYSDMLTEVSRHFCWLNNKSLEIRTVSGVYLIAMKMVAHRDYRNDFSDAIGILLEETEAGTHFSYNDIEIAYQKLYHKTPDTKTADRFRELCAMSREELKRLYDSQKNAESLIRNQLLTYLEDGADINTHNITEVIRIIREKMDQGS